MSGVVVHIDSPVSVGERVAVAMRDDQFVLAFYYQPEHWTVAKAEQKCREYAGSCGWSPAPAERVPAWFSAVQL